MLHQQNRCLDVSSTNLPCRAKVWRGWSFSNNLLMAVAFIFFVLPSDQKSFITFLNVSYDFSKSFCTALCFILDLTQMSWTHKIHIWLLRYQQFFINEELLRAECEFFIYVSFLYIVPIMVWLQKNVLPLSTTGITSSYEADSDLIKSIRCYLSEGQQRRWRGNAGIVLQEKTRPGNVF